MKNFLDKMLSLLPYCILILLFGTILVFVYKGILTYERYVEIVKILLWPTIVLMSLLFFRKVFTYLFFSMEEFNFFGAKGSLRDIREIIDEKVEERIQEEHTQKETDTKIAGISSELEILKKSKSELGVENEKSIALTNKLLDMYSELSKEHKETTKELNEFRRRQEEKELRMTSIKERMAKRILKERGEEDKLSTVFRQY